jgi:hypothetical protein
MPKPPSLGLQLLGYLIGLLFSATGWVSYVLGYIIIGLMIMVSAWTVYAWLKDVRQMSKDKARLATENSNLRDELDTIKQEREELRTENEELVAKASVVSAWDDPEFKFTNVNKKTFRNESVPLDGRLYTNCTFINVTFVYKGEQPYGLVAYKILGKDTAVRAEGAPLGAYLRLLNVLGYIKQGVEKGDELRPDAASVRIEDGEVEIFESKEEEDQRIRRENEQLKAERDA